MARRSDLGANGVNARFVISVPHRFNVDLETRGGSINVDDLEGNVTANTSGGSLLFGRIAGDVGSSVELGEVLALDVLHQILFRETGEIIEAVAVDEGQRGGQDRVAEVQRYVPGYRLRSEPQFDEASELWNGLARVAVFLEITGNGDYPAVAGANTFRDLHNAWFTNDPFKLPNEADGKLLPLINATDWTTNVGHPGVCSPAVAEVYNTFVVPNMFARAVRGDQTPEESIRTAAQEATAIYDAWRQRGLV